MSKYYWVDSHHGARSSFYGSFESRESCVKNIMDTCAEAYSDGADCDVRIGKYCTIDVAEFSPNLDDILILMESVISRRLYIPSGYLEGKDSLLECREECTDEAVAELTKFIKSWVGKYVRVNDSNGLPSYVEEETFFPEDENEK